MSKIEEMLKRTNDNDLGSIVEEIVNLYGADQTYFQAKTSDGMTVFIHHSNKEKEMEYLLEEAEEVIQDAKNEYEEINDTKKDQ